ncbi:IS1096 element passenger TnpR family protein [Planctomicrobium sp. SH527]|uniref:IS1096 element passenger TnpR family protein n=1 Tax=Planctomicrobium sp. SH527 TaxID=3448123 RepID=UPI003F5C94D2
MDSKNCNDPQTDSKTKFPLCLEGGRACPPEEIGGPWGYVDGLAALHDPRHERHDEMVEWLSEFDPEAFDVRKATKEMRKVK